MMLNCYNSVLKCIIISQLFLNLSGRIDCAKLMENDSNENMESIGRIEKNMVKSSTNLRLIEPPITRAPKSLKKHNNHLIGLSIMPEDKMLDAWSKPDTFKVFGNPNSPKSTPNPQLNGRKTGKDVLKDDDKKEKSPKEQFDSYKQFVLKFLALKGLVTVTQPTSTTTTGKMKVKDDLKSSKERGKNILQAIPQYK